MARALARIETAAARVDAATQGACQPAADQQTEAENHKLRSEAGAVLAELDRLIADLEGEASAPDAPEDPATFQGLPEGRGA